MKRQIRWILTTLAGISTTGGLNDSPVALLAVIDLGLVASMPAIGRTQNSVGLGVLYVNPFHPH